MALDQLQCLSVRGAGILLTVMALPACTDPSFEFRGYTDLSDCRHVIDAEMAQGATFEDAYDSSLRSQPELVTELAGQLYDEAVIIEVACSLRGSVRRIFYVLEAQDPAETGRVFIRFADELGALFGEPAEDVVPGRRSLQYLCSELAPITLQEEQLSEDEHELFLSIVPDAAACMAAQ